MSTKLKLVDSKDDPVRFSFLDLHEAVEYEVGDGKPRYNATLIIKIGGANDKKIKAAIAAEALAAWGKAADKTVESYKNNKQKHCYTEGDADPKEYDGYAGNMILSAHRRAKDGPVGVYGDVIDPKTGKVVVLGPLSGKPYSGSYGNVTVEIYAQPKGNPGVRCGLQAVQFTRDGDSFSGARPASPDDFEPISEGADAEEMT